MDEGHRRYRLRSSSTPAPSTEQELLASLRAQVEAAEAREGAWRRRALVGEEGELSCVLWFCRAWFAVCWVLTRCIYIYITTEAAHLRRRVGEQEGEVRRLRQQVR